MAISNIILHMLFHRGKILIVYFDSKSYELIPNKIDLILVGNFDINLLGI
jgi:hypothetical protein